MYQPTNRTKTIDWLPVEAGPKTKGISRRGLLRDVAGFAAFTAAAGAQSRPSRPFGPLKHVDAGVLNVAYAEAGPPMGARSSFCTAGPTTSTAMPTWRRRSPGPAIG
jgi:hypothetical protein